MLLKDAVIGAGRVPDLLARVAAQDCGQVNASERWRYSTSALASLLRAATTALLVEHFDGRWTLIRGWLIIAASDGCMLLLTVKFPPKDERQLQKAKEKQKHLQRTVSAGAEGVSAGASAPRPPPARAVRRQVPPAQLATICRQLSLQSSARRFLPKHTGKTYEEVPMAGAYPFVVSLPAGTARLLWVRGRLKWGEGIPLL